MIFSPTGAGNIWLGFAIPVNEAREMLYFLVNGGPWVGILDVMPNSQGYAAHFRLGTDQGVVVTGLAERSPAVSAGLKPFDVVLQVDGKPVKNGEELRSAIFAHRIGDEIALRVNRAGKDFDVKVKAGKVSGMVFGG